MRCAQLRGIGALDRVLRRQQIEQHDADGVDLARDGRRLPEQQLRGHVSWRAARISVGPMFVRESEIHQQDPAAILAHHVAGLDVAVEKSRRVHRPGCPADVDSDKCRFVGPHGTLRR